MMIPINKLLQRFFILLVTPLASIGFPGARASLSRIREHQYSQTAVMYIGSPQAPGMGDRYFDFHSKSLYEYNGVTWVPCCDDTADGTAQDSSSDMIDLYTYSDGVNVYESRDRINWSIKE